MKTHLKVILAPAALAAAICCNPASAQVYSGGAFGGGFDVRADLTIHSDGTSLFTTSTVESRAAKEQQLRMMEQMEAAQAANSGSEEPTNPPPETASTNEVKAFTDAELVKKITGEMDERNQDDNEKLQVHVDKDTITTITTQSFDSPGEMIKNSYLIWRASGIQFENARLETDTNGLLRLTLTPQAGMARYQKTLLSEWKMSGAKMDLKLVFPGRVVSSDFPGTQTNSTWLALDATNDTSLNAATKLYSAPTVITAEAGGLKLDHPLEAKDLWRAARTERAGVDDLPVTDAGPGFVAEAQSITTTTLHVFPGGEEYFTQNMEPTGAVVTVKLYAPKGRTMKSVNSSRVIAAVDNQGRSIKTTSDEEGQPDEEVSEGMFAGNGSQETASLNVELRLQLPQPDAQSIDKLSAEAVAATVGSWQEMTLTNLQESATNEIDLAGVLPGAKIVFEKVTVKDGQINIQATLNGPPAIQRLEVRASIPGGVQFNSNSFDRQSHLKNGQATRKLQISGYGYGENGNLAPQQYVVVIRYPTDMRRERVKFDLKALDLF